MTDQPSYMDEIINSRKEWNPKDKLFVYVLWDGKEVVYVGQTRDIKQRLVAHEKTKDFTDYGKVECNSQKEMNEIESNLIIRYKPIYNKKIGASHINIVRVRAKVKSFGGTYRGSGFYINKIREMLVQGNFDVIVYKGIEYIPEQEFDFAVDYILDKGGN